MQSDRWSSGKYWILQYSVFACFDEPYLSHFLRDKIVRFHPGSVGNAKDMLAGHEADFSIKHREAPLVRSLTLSINAMLKSITIRHAASWSAVYTLARWSIIVTPRAQAINYAGFGTSLIGSANFQRPLPTLIVILWAGDCADFGWQPSLTL